MKYTKRGNQDGENTFTALQLSLVVIPAFTSNLKLQLLPITSTGETKSVAASKKKKKLKVVLYEYLTIQLKEKPIKHNHTNA